MEELTERERIELITSIAGIISSVIIIAGGVYLLFDDLDDVPRFDRIHHWHWGVMLIMLGVLNAIINAFKILIIIDKEFERRVLEWLEEIRNLFLKQP